MSTKKAATSVSLISASLKNIGWLLSDIVQVERRGSLGDPIEAFAEARLRFASEGWLPGIDLIQAVRISHDWRNVSDDSPLKGKVAEMLRDRMKADIEALAAMPDKTPVKLYRLADTGKYKTISGKECARLLWDYFGGPDIPEYQPQYRAMTCNRRGAQIHVAMVAAMFFRGAGSLSQVDFPLPVSLHEEVQSEEAEEKIRYEENDQQGKADYDAAGNYVRFRREYARDKSRSLTTVASELGLNRNECLWMQALDTLDTLYPSLRIESRLNADMETRGASWDSTTGQYRHVAGGGYLPASIMRDYQALNTLIGGSKTPGYNAGKGGTPDAIAVAAMGGAGVYKTNQSANSQQVEEYFRLRMGGAGGGVKTIPRKHIKDAADKLAMRFPAKHPSRLAYDVLALVLKGDLTGLMAIATQPAEETWEYKGSGIPAPAEGLEGTDTVDPSEESEAPATKAAQAKKATKRGKK